MTTIIRGERNSNLVFRDAATNHSEKRKRCIDHPSSLLRSRVSDLKTLETQNRGHVRRANTNRFRTFLSLSRLSRSTISNRPREASPDYLVELTVGRTQWVGWLLRIGQTIDSGRHSNGKERAGRRKNERMQSANATL